MKHKLTNKIEKIYILDDNRCFANYFNYNSLPDIYTKIIEEINIKDSNTYIKIKNNFDEMNNINLLNIKLYLNGCDDINFLNEYSFNAILKTIDGEYLFIPSGYEFSGNIEYKKVKTNYGISIFYYNDEIKFIVRFIYKLSDEDVNKLLMNKKIGYNEYNNFYKNYDYSCD